MKLQRMRLLSILLMCFGGFGLIGMLMGYALHGHPVLAAVALGLVMVGPALAWWKWGDGDKRDDVRHWVRIRWWRVKRLPLRVLDVLLGQ